MHVTACVLVCAYMRVIVVVMFMFFLLSVPMPSGVPGCAAQQNWPERFENISTLQTGANQ